MYDVNSKLRENLSKKFRSADKKVSAHGDIEEEEEELEKGEEKEEEGEEEHGFSGSNHRNFGLLHKKVGDVKIRITTRLLADLTKMTCVACNTYFLPESVKNITSPPNVSAASTKPSRSFIFFVSVSAARSSKYLKLKTLLIQFQCFRQITELMRYKP